MAQIFVIDDLGGLEAYLERALEGSDFEIRSYFDFVQAKRALLELSSSGIYPELILSRASLQNNPDGGYRFAAELARHESFSKIAVLLIAEELNEAVIRQASQSGARSVLPWPLSVEALRKRLGHYLSLEQYGRAASTGAEDSSSGSVLVELESEAQRKLQYAQQLLARGLLNFKTSALLDVVDYEDVPQVLLEIIRAVCQDAGEPRLKQPESEEPQVGDSTASGSKVELNLDAIFGLSKGNK